MGMEWEGSRGHRLALISPVAEAWVLRRFLRSLETLDKNEWQVQSRQPQVAGC